jgi:hypothetical protein
MWLTQGIYAYVTLDEGVETSEELRKELINAVRNEIGAFGEWECALAGRWRYMFACRSSDFVCPLNIE